MLGRDGPQSNKSHQPIDMCIYIINTHTHTHTHTALNELAFLIFSPFFIGTSYLTDIVWWAGTIASKWFI